MAGLAVSGQQVRGYNEPARRFNCSRPWHASACKNTAHAAGLTHALEMRPMANPDPICRRVVLFNLDTDNVPLTAFWRGVLQASPPRGAICGDVTGPATGRIGYTAHQFVQVGGYDNEPGIAPSGHQDIDIKARIHRYSNSGAAIVREGAGVFAPNSKVRAADRGEAKITNCSTDSRTKWATWDAMNTWNRSAMQKKAKTSRNCIRNMDESFGSLSFSQQVQHFLHHVISTSHWCMITPLQSSRSPNWAAATPAPFPAAFGGGQSPALGGESPEPAPLMPLRAKAPSPATLPPTSKAPPLTLRSAGGGSSSFSRQQSAAAPQPATSAPPAAMPSAMAAARAAAAVAAAAPPRPVWAPGLLAPPPRPAPPAPASAAAAGAAAAASSTAHVVAETRIRSASTTSKCAGGWEGEGRAGPGRGFGRGWSSGVGGCSAGQRAGGFAGSEGGG